MDKEYYILLDGEKIPVTEEVYYAYKRAEWRESKQAKARAQRECSYNFMVENGFEGQAGPKQAFLDEIVADKLLLDDLLEALAELTDDERFLIGELFYNEKSEREVAKETGVPRKTIAYRKSRILSKLKNLLEKI